MSYIKWYQDNPTQGGVDGTALSEGTEAAPLTLGPLDRTINQESAVTTLAIRCDPTYMTTGDVGLLPSGTTATHWALAPQVGGVAGTFMAYGATLTLSTTVYATNERVFGKCKATSDESPVNDTSVDLWINANIVAQ